MTNENIKSIFPLDGEVTQEMLKDPSIMNQSDCTGARSLKAALAGKGIIDKRVSWGAHMGIIISEGDETLVIESTTNMMGVNRPIRVVFTLKPEPKP